MTGILDVDGIYIAFAQALVACGDERTAAIAVGVHVDTVDDFISKAREHPEVLRILVEDKMARPDFNDKDSVKEYVFKNLWKEATFKGIGSNHSARITALTKIADLAGIEAPQQMDANAINGGVMAIPVISAADWDKSCEEMQVALKAAARD